MKKIVSILLASIMLVTCGALLSACGKSEKVVIWTFTDELEEMVTDYYLKDNKNVEIEVVSTPIAALGTKLDNALRTGTNLPDMVALEEKVLRKYIDSGKFVSLDDIVTDEVESDMYDYTLDAARSASGEVQGLAWQATPGAYFYRRSMADALWGDSSPEFVQTKVNTWDNFLNTAQELKALDTDDFSDVRILSSLTEPAKVFYAQRDCGWVDEDNNLTVSENLYSADPNLYDVMYDLQGGTANALYVNQQVEWNAGWFGDMSANKVFGFFQSSWGLHYNLKKNATNSTTGVSTEGDWGVVQGPGSFSDGGTWLAVLSTSDKADACKDIIKYFTTDEDFLMDWAKSTGDYMNNSSVMEEVKVGYSDEFLGGQNHYEVLFEAAKTLQGNHLTKYDSTLNSIFQEWAVNYAVGSDSLGNSYTKQGALEQFTTSVGQQYTDIVT